tara:strand:- start:394 stop:774 length:381 start_codon:yes stop_codon:yes gene_type:complete
MKIKKSSNKSFGLVFCIVFLLIGIWPLLNNETYRLWALVISIIFMILGLVNSKFLTPLNNLWFKFGISLGKFISPLVMAVIFFFVVTPIAIFMRIFKKDLLNLKYNDNNSYWIKKDVIKSKMKNQF